MYTLRWRPSTRRADAWSPLVARQAALLSPPGCAPHQPRCCGDAVMVTANNYSPLPPLPPLRPTAAPRRAGQTQVVQPRGPHRNARQRLMQAADRMHAPSNERLPFRRAPPVGRATGRLPTAPGARPAANQRWRGEAIDDDHVARDTCLPQHLRTPGHPIGVLMEATIDARDADPVASTATPIYLERRCPFVMTANMPSGDDRTSESRRRGPAPAHHGAAPGVPSGCQSRQKRL